MPGLSARHHDLVNSRIAYTRVEHRNNGADIGAGTFMLGCPKVALLNRLRVARVGLHMVEAGAVNSNFDIQYYKVIGNDSGRNSNVFGKQVPMLTNAATGFT